MANASDKVIDRITHDVALCDLKKIIKQLSNNSLETEQVRVNANKQ